MRACEGECCLRNSSRRGIHGSSPFNWPYDNVLGLASISRLQYDSSDARGREEKNTRLIQ
jgi:hypothetical protein